MPNLPYASHTNGGQSRNSPLTIERVEEAHAHLPHPLVRLSCYYVKTCSPAGVEGGMRKIVPELGCLSPPPRAKSKGSRSYQTASG